MAGSRRTTWMATLAALALGAAGCGKKEEMKCPAGQTACGGVCVDTTSDPSNCVYCGFRCAAGASCTPAGCQCPAGEAPCGGTCVSLSTDSNCGACGHACGAGTCSGATPACACTTPAISCGPTASPECVDVLASDPLNCGGCGIRCGTSGSCTAGVCACTGATTLCPSSNPRCADLSSDEKNCGSCGTACDTAAGQTCSAGHCCGSGLTWCGGPSCVNTATDGNNCGGCAGTCGATCVCGVSDTCSAGHCCGNGLTWCGGPLCVNTSTDPSNCRGCGTTCSPSQICSGAMCVCPPATPLACGTNCCAGTACCAGNACQPAHSNGLGQTYYDCHAPGTPGSIGTYTVTMAVEAGEAWAPGSSGNAAFTCGGGFCYSVVAGGKCAVWCYDGLLSGRVDLDSVGITCLCPTQTSTPWY